MLASVILERELNRWRAAGRSPRLWWRDDDAAAAPPALRRLLSLAAETAVPLALAVIPAALQPELVPLVDGHNGVWALQHGTDHQDAGGSRRPIQFAPTAPVEAVIEAIGAGHDRLAAFRRALPIYVPPWNNLERNVEAALVRLGFEGVSAQGRALGRQAPRRADVHLDLMRWGERPAFRGRGRLLLRLAALLKARRLAQTWDEPVGLLTHHLAHDEPAWRFLGWLLAWAPLQSAWRPVTEVFDL